MSQDFASYDISETVLLTGFYWENRISSNYAVDGYLNFWGVESWGLDWDGNLDYKVADYYQIAEYVPY